MPAAPPAATRTAENRPPCVVHVDLDGFTDICRVHDWPVTSAHDFIHESGMRNGLEFLARHEIRATLFAIAQDVGEAAKQRRLREAVARGHEIGSHSLSHRDLTRLPRSEKRREVLESRQRLEQALGVAVRGFRAPGFAMDGDMCDLLESAGYDYDSSLFPDSRTAKRVGVTSIPCTPHIVGTCSRLVELPMPAHAPLPVPFHPSYSLVLGGPYFRLGLQRARRTGAPLVLLFHLTDFADPVPNDNLPNWKAKFFTLSFMSSAAKLRRCTQMLQLVRRHYRVLSTAELLLECGAMNATTAASKATPA